MRWRLPKISRLKGRHSKSMCFYKVMTSTKTVHHLMKTTICNNMTMMENPWLMAMVFLWFQMELVK